jgi:hypothetical protein
MVYNVTERNRQHHSKLKTFLLAVVYYATKINRHHLKQLEKFVQVNGLPELQKLMLKDFYLTLLRILTMKIFQKKLQKMMLQMEF